MIFSGNHMDQSEKWRIQIILLILTPSPTECNSELKRTTPFTDITPWNTPPKWREFGHFYLESVLAAQSCSTLYNTMDYSLPGFTVHGILPARTLEWGAIPFSRGSSWPKDWTRVSPIVGRFFTIWATREVANFQFTNLKMLLQRQS